MVESVFKHVRFAGIKTVIPKDFINIDDEIKYFGNNPKKLARAKKMIGFGKRYLTNENTTAADLCFEAATLLITEMNVNKEEIDGLIFLSQCRNYYSPASANILQGDLELSQNCAAFDISQGCSGYVYALWLASSMIASGACKKIILLSGDTMSKHSYNDNRLVAPIFGDSGSATFLEYTDEENPSYFVLGSDGTGWDKIVIPAGGEKIPVDDEITKTDIIDEAGNRWNLRHLIMQGVDVFNFTIDKAPDNINRCITLSGLAKDDISMFALHQANKQIVDAVANKAEIPLDKTPSDTFSEYGNTTCNSVATVLTHHLLKQTEGMVLTCGYGMGLSWASGIINMKDVYNGGFSYFSGTDKLLTKQQLKDYWKNQFVHKGEKEND